MPTRNVVLTERHEALINELLASGRYQNASEILRDGLRLIEERNAIEAAKLEVLRQAANVGTAAIEAGAYRKFHSFDDLTSYLTVETDQILARE